MTASELAERLALLRAMEAETERWTTSDRDASLAAIRQEIEFVSEDLASLRDERDEVIGPWPRGTVFRSEL